MIEKGPDFLLEVLAFVANSGRLRETPASTIPPWAAPGRGYLRVKGTVTISLPIAEWEK